MKKAPVELTRDGKVMPPLRQLWQVPIFFAGLAALATVIIMHPPIGASSTGRQVEKILGQARRALAETPPDLDTVSARATQAIEQAEASSPQAAEAHYLLGTALLRQGNRLKGKTRVQTLDKGRKQLEMALALPIPDEVRPRLLHDLGKVYALLNLVPDQVVAWLGPTLPKQSDDPFEDYGLLAQAYLHLPTPDPLNALTATRKQLDLPNVDEVALTPPRLLYGELLIQLDRPGEAKKVLARIGKGATPESLFRARTLLARIYQDEGSWVDAARMWELVKDDTLAVSIRQGRIRYFLGLCYRRQEMNKEAAAAWMEAFKAGGEEGQAAAFGLVELRLHGDKPEDALEAFEWAVQDVKKPEDYHNDLFTLAEARSLFDAVCRYFLQQGKYELAEQVAAIYEKLAEPGMAQELSAQAAEVWGQAILDSKQPKSSPEELLKLEDAARDQFQKAGTALTRAAGQSDDTKRKADWLNRSADNYLKAKVPAQAATALEQLVQLQLPPARQGEAYYRLGEAQRSLHNTVAAQDAYRNCIRLGPPQYPGPFAYRARYQLAAIELDARNLDQAEDILLQNLELMNSDPDAEAREKTVFALARLFYQKKDYRKAYEGFQEGIKEYPATANATAIRFQMAQCCLKIAEDYDRQRAKGGLKDTDMFFLGEMRKKLQDAANTYQELVDELTAKQASRSLTTEEGDILTQSEFTMADIQYFQGDYAEALRRYQILAAKKEYQNKVERLIALQGAWQSLNSLEKFDQARAILEDMRVALYRDIPANAFEPGSGTRSKESWSKWLEDKIRRADANRTPPR